jgi:MFS family permease
MATFHLDSAGVGFLSSTFFYSYLVLQIPGGLLLDRWGVRKIVILGVLLFVIGLCLFATTTTLWVAIFARLLMGAATAPAVASVICLGANWFSLARFAMVVGLTEMVGSLGAVFGEGVMSHWVQTMGWQSSLVVWIVFGVVLAVAMLFWVYDQPISNVKVVNQQSSESAGHDMYAHARAISGNLQIWLNGLYCGLQFAVNAAFAGLWGVPFMQRVHGLSFQASAWLVVLVPFGVILGGPFVGYMCDRMGMHRMFMRMGAIGGTVVTICLIVIPIHNLVFLGFILLLMGFFSATYVIPFANIKNLVAIEARGVAMAVANTFCILVGAPILQPLFGWILHHGLERVTADGIPVYSIQAFQWGMWSLVACTVLGFVLTFAMNEATDYTSVVSNDTPDTDLGAHHKLDVDKKTNTHA